MLKISMIDMSLAINLRLESYLPGVSELNGFRVDILYYNSCYVNYTLYTITENKRSSISLETITEDKKIVIVRRAGLI